MDRRAVWIVMPLLVALGRPATAMQSLADPSAQGPVGFAPVPSLDQINGSTRVPGSAPAFGASPAASLTNPTASGPAATLPTSPVGTEPVGLTPLPPLQKSLDRGYRFGRFSDLFRKEQPAVAQPRQAPPAARPAPNAWSPDSAVRRAVHPQAVEPPTVATPRGRPAPYADRIPETARRQSDPTATGERPNPLAEAQPRRARPRTADDSGPPVARPTSSSTADYRPQGPRPQVGVPNGGAATPAAEPPALELIPPAPPALDPTPAAPLVIPAPEAIPIPDPSPKPGAAPETPPIVEAAAIAPQPAAEPGTPAEPAPLPIPEPKASPIPTIAAASPTADPLLVRTGADATALRMNVPIGRETQFATLRAAAVGDEVITIHELMVAVNERIQDYVDPSNPVSPEQLKRIKNEVAPHVLQQLIEQTLILQEAKRAMKDEKKLKSFYDQMDKVWLDEEVPPLLRKYNVTNEYELKVKLDEKGKSYQGMKDAYRRKIMSHEFLRKEISNKMTSDLVEMRAYYNNHLHDYDKPARMSWREIEVNTSRHPDRVEARKKADEILAKLARGEDFAAVARSSSEGPTASAGGLYAEISSGGYGIAPVNDALGKLPVGKLSGVIEAPASFHIVRLESRREAGPLGFDEVQDQVRREVFNANRDKAFVAYMEKLRSRTLIRTMFDRPPAAAAKVQTASKP